MPKLLQLKDIVTHNTRVAARNGAASSRDNGQVTRQLDCHVAAHHTQISSHVGHCHVGHCKSSEHRAGCYGNRKLYDYEIVQCSYGTDS